MRRQLEKIGESMERSSGGDKDLTVRVPVLKKDVTAGLSRNINIFIAGMHDIFYRLKHVAEESRSIGGGLQESAKQVEESLQGISENMTVISDHGQELNHSMQSVESTMSEIDGSINLIAGKIVDQSSATTQSSAAIEEMVASIKNIESIAEERTRLASSLSATAESGENNMRDTVGSIADISASTGVIRDLLEVINGIAEQTGILAINAAIEAAHAGTAGKGFSVVAGEIRKLSETTAMNANRISESLEQIVSRIRTAEQLTDETGLSIHEMAEGIRQLIDGMAEMSAGMKELSAGTAEITTSLELLRNSSIDVDGSIQEIQHKSGDIGQSVNHVVKITGKTTDALMGISGDIETIVQATSRVSSLSAQNSEYIEIMEREINSFRTVDKSSLKSREGQALLDWNTEVVNVPPPPAGDGGSYEKDDERYWYDKEWGVWKVKKSNIPESPADGSSGKRIIALSPLDHPYYQAWHRGMKTLSEALDIDVETMIADWNPGTQYDHVKRAISRKPDLIILSPCHPGHAVSWFSEINAAGIPAVCSNIQPENEAFQYFLAYTGPDEWGNFRSLAHDFADRMNYRGNYCIVQHLPGSSVFDARTYALITELKKIAPEMSCLEMASTDLVYEKTLNKVDEWVNKYGSDLKGIVSADDSDTMRGIVETLEKHGREDVIRVSQGTSQVGLNLVKKGKLHAISHLSAETDGALPVEVADDFFNGQNIQPIRYLPRKIITRGNVENFFSPQW